MGVRRVVTGHDADGKAIFTSDDEVEPKTLSLLPGTDFYRFWGGDKTSSFPGDGSPPSAPRYFPPVGGFRVGIHEGSPPLPPAPRPRFRLPPLPDRVQLLLRFGLRGGGGDAGPGI